MIQTTSRTLHCQPPIRQGHRDALLQVALNVGRIIIDDIFRGDLDAWRRRAAKDVSVRELAKRPDMPDRLYLQRAGAIYELQQRAGASMWNHLGVSHLRAVLPAPEDRQLKLL